MLNGKKLVATLLAMSLLGATMVGCAKKDDAPAGDASNPGSTGGVDTSKEVNLSFYLWGSEGVGNPGILAEVNKKLKADLNATLEIKYIDWPDVATKYPLLFASGEKFDLSYGSPTAAVSYYTLAEQGALKDITTMLDTVAPKLKAEIPAETWKATESKGKIYGVPSLYSEFTPTGYAYNSNLREKYKLDPITDIASMEAYMDAVVKNEKYAPINGNSLEAQNMFRMLVETTGQWLEAPGISVNEIHLITESADKWATVSHPAFSQEFEDWAVKMREWSDKGYFNKDILSSQFGGKDNLLNGISAGYVTHMADWTGTYGGLIKAQPDLKTDFYCFPESNGKIKRKMGVENATVISESSSNPERSLMAIEKFMTDESYYNLLQYGIEGKQYEVVDGLVREPANFNKDVDAGGFATWSLRNDKFNIPRDTEDTRRYTLNEEWNKVAINNPYMGFSFDPKAVSAEISSITNVNSQIGIQIMLGKTKEDPKAAVALYREQLKKAGIEKVVAEVQTQLAGFTPIG